MRKYITKDCLKMAEQETELLENNGDAEEEEPHSDVEDDDLQKPAWVGYFRLPKKDVELRKPFLPTDE